MKKLHKILVAAICFALGITTIGPMRLSNVIANEEDREISNRSAISFFGDIGYYIKDDVVMKYNRTLKTSEAMPLPKNEVVSVAYDGVNIYLQHKDTKISAYREVDQKLIWETEDLKMEGCTNIGYGPMYVSGDKLYSLVANNTVYTPNQNLVVLTTEDGNLVQKIQGSYRYANNSIPYQIDGEVYYSAQDIAHRNTQGKGSFIQLSIDYNDNQKASVYDVDANMVFAARNNGTIWVSPYDVSAAYLEMVETNMKIEGRDIRATRVNGQSVFLTLVDGTLVLYIFNGVEFIQQKTQLEATTTASVSFLDGEVFVNGKDTILSTTLVKIPNTVRSEEVQAIDAEILKLKKEVGYQSITLEHATSIDGLQKRYEQSVVAGEKGVFYVPLLDSFVASIAKQRGVVKQLNTDIQALPDVDAFSRADSAQAKTYAGIYQALSAFNKTLIDEKLQRVMEKVAAYDVEEAIAKLPSLSAIQVGDLAGLQEVRKKYEALIAKWKKEVKNYASFVELENKLYDLLNQATLGDAYWSNYGGNAHNTATTNTKTPRSEEELVSSMKVSGDFQEPIIIDDRIYAVRDSSFLSVMNTKGEIIAEAALYGKTGFFSRIAYGDGKIFVPLKDRIQAFDAKTLQPLWITQAEGMQMISTLTYHNGYLYSGATTGGGGDRGKTNGFYFGIQVQDEDSTNSFEIKDYAWKQSKDKNTGYYWAGGAVAKTTIVVAGDEGMLYSFDLRSGAVVDSFYLGDTKVRSNVSYIAEEQMVLVGTQDSHKLYKVKMKADGTFQKNRIQQADEVGEITGGIATYKGRSYVPSGGMYGNGFSVIDTNTLDVIYKIDGIGTQSYPLISTAYADSGNKYQVYLYVINYKSGELMLIKDQQGQTKPDYRLLATGFGTYNSGSLTPDAYGNLYLNGADAMFGYRQVQAAFTAADMERSISNFPNNFSYEHKKELQQLRKQFQTLPKEEQAKVANRDLLLTYEAKMEEYTQTKVSMIQQCIDTLPKVITLQEQEGIQKALFEYATLLESDQIRIQNYISLEQAREALEVLLGSYQQLIKEIEELDIDTITLQDEGRIRDLVARYERLSDLEKAAITNADTLFLALDKVKLLNDRILIVQLEHDIDQLPDLTDIHLAYEKSIKDIRYRYDQLHPIAQVEVKNYKALQAYGKEIEKQRTHVDSLNDDIWNLLVPLHINWSDKAVIEDLTARYLIVKAENRKFIKNYEDVISAKRIVDKMDQGYLDQEIFKRIAIAKSAYHFTNTTLLGSPYSITFQGSEITNPMDFAFAISTQSMNEKFIRTLANDALIVQFAHRGILPGKATIRLQVNVKDGSYRLYTYDEIHKKAKMDAMVEVKDGYVEFSTTQGASFFITQQVVDEGQIANDRDYKVSTGDQQSFPALWAMLILSSGFLLLSLRKRIR